MRLGRKVWNRRLHCLEVNVQMHWKPTFLYMNPVLKDFVEFPYFISAFLLMCSFFSVYDGSSPGAIARTAKVFRVTYDLKTSVKDKPYLEMRTLHKFKLWWSVLLKLTLLTDARNVWTLDYLVIKYQAVLPRVHTCDDMSQFKIRLRNKLLQIVMQMLFK